MAFMTSKLILFFFYQIVSLIYTDSMLFFSAADIS